MLKSNRLTLAIFSLPFLFLISPLVGNFVGRYDLPGFLANPVLFFYLFSIAPFGIFNILGIHLVGGGEGIAFSEPNGFFGWVIILFVWAIVYYLIASVISRRITDDKKRNVLFYILSLIALAYACLLIFYSVALAKKDQLINKRGQECLAPAQQSYDSCVAVCQTNSGLFGPVSERVVNKETEVSYMTCFNNCDVTRENFIKKCNMQGQSQ